MKKKIILDVDTGMDDAVAIAIASLAPQLEILGITVTHGNLPLANTLENTLRVLEFLGKDIPVYSGCPEPMVQYMTAGRLLNVRRQKTTKVVNGREIKIHDDYLPLPVASIKPQTKHACSYIIETLHKSDEKITLVPVGPLTNIGMALRMDPTIREKIEEIVIMGGGISHGNRTPVAEANFYDDPEAAQIVLSSGCQTRVFTLDATESVLADKQKMEQFRSYSRAGRLVADLVDNFIDNCTLLGIDNNGKVSVHDAVTICALINPDIVTDIRYKNCDVDFSGGFADGQLVIDNRTYVEITSRNQIAYAIDSDRCWQIMADVIKMDGW
jgi:inosine-uridine nucleoside N-ribohydrolase